MRVDMSVIKLSGGEIKVDSCVAAGGEMSGGKIKIKTLGEEKRVEKMGIEMTEHNGSVGNGMSGGKIIIDNFKGMGAFMGYKAKGGAIFVENAEGADFVGGKSENAIFVRKARDFLGDKKNGGVLIVEEAGDYIGRGTRIDDNEQYDGTLLVTRYTDSKIGKSKLYTFIYDEDLGTYHHLLESGHFATSDYIINDNELSAFKKAKKGLAIINNFENITWNITDNMEGGILVLRDLPEGHLGKNMKNCAVIVDVWTDIDPKDVKKLIDKDRKPGDGLILMRVPDPEHLERTKLIDLEAE